MDLALRDRFRELWNTYFPGAELPVTFYYTDDADRAERAKSRGRRRCFVCDLAKVRRGRSQAFGADAVACRGAKRYLGFTDRPMPHFECFLAHGLPGEVEGERYKKTPELARSVIEQQPPCRADGEFIVFKRWDKLEEPDDPAVVVFFAGADVLSGLFTLANYDSPDTNAVYAPFTAGCSTITHFPYDECRRENPRAVLGMFDVTARRCVQGGVLTLAVPIGKFTAMVENMAESFLCLDDWRKVKERIARRAVGDR